MHGRLQGPHNIAVPAAADRWDPGAQGRPAVQVMQQPQQVLAQQQQRLYQQQQYEQELQQQLLAQQEYEQGIQQQLAAQEDYGLQQLNDQRLQELVEQQRERQLLLVQQQQQQAEADAFPDFGLVRPDWQPADADPQVASWGVQPPLQQRVQSRTAALPPLPGRAACFVASGVMGSGGRGGNWAQQPQQEQEHCILHGGQAVDEFGVPIEPSISDDESEANAACGQASVTAPAADQQPQPWISHHLAVPSGQGFGGMAAHAFSRPSALAAAGQVDGSSGTGHMAAFLRSRSRDFAVPRIGKPLQLTPQREGQAPAPGQAAG